MTRPQVIAAASIHAHSALGCFAPGLIWPPAHALAEVAIRSFLAGHEYAALTRVFRIELLTTRS